VGRVGFSGENSGGGPKKIENHRSKRHGRSLNAADEISKFRKQNERSRAYPGVPGDTYVNGAAAAGQARGGKNCTPAKRLQNRFNDVTI